ncbi:MAG: hypothetical protein PUJ05_06355 [Clostridium sp.]|uniref:hypothetical protein n=1 Tax=Clostridium sp. TaxID=1506 RepID=UPI0026723FB1|nr:hypothetical protein [Clostridium sp.]MCI7030208.1 hypothetical protein [Clostridium sp.]MDD7682564.1 hypothetical protein [Clostridium sp.]MDY2581089.1 hypothetical protein [Clostridium sp.]
MERISSSLFCLSLLVYYLPKLFKAKKKIYVKAHMILGSISVLTMVTAMILKLGQADFVKYIGFSMIMIAIGVTGAVMEKNYKFYRVLHVIFSISFFIYLPLAIKFM